MPEEANLELQVMVDPEADAELLDASTRQLRRELLELDVENVERPSGGAPPVGARAIEAVALGALVVTLVKNAPALTALLQTLFQWVSHGDDRTVKLQMDGDTLEVSHVSAADQERLISSWIERHATAE